MSIGRMAANAGIALSMLLLAACDGGALPTYRYRMTVEVDTPAGLRTGSSVIEVQSLQASSYAIPDAGSVYHAIWGEAVAVKLPSGDGLYAALSRVPGGPGAERYAMAAFRPGPDYRTAQSSLLTHRELGILPADEYPILVRFRNRLDPATVERVDAGDLQKSFGPGYALRRITIRITDDPVTTGLQQQLPWLDLDFEGKYSVERKLDRRDDGGPQQNATLAETLQDSELARTMVDRDFLRQGRR